jgi:hypothetical protein
MMTPQDERSYAEEEIGRSRFCGFRDFLDHLDGYITTSRFGHFFRLSGSGHVRNSTHPLFSRTSSTDHFF